MDMIVVTTRNESAAVIYDDHCGGEVQGFEYLGYWNASYGVGRGCSFVESERLPEHQIAIPPGTEHVDVFHVNGHAYAGTWRVELLLRDAAGNELPLRRRVSNTFRVVRP
jgi:hypothetical protein